MTIFSPVVDYRGLIDRKAKDNRPFCHDQKNLNKRIVNTYFHSHSISFITSFDHNCFSNTSLSIHTDHNFANSIDHLRIFFSSFSFPFLLLFLPSLFSFIFSIDFFRLSFVRVQRLKMETIAKKTGRLKEMVEYVVLTSVEIYIDMLWSIALDNDKWCETDIEMTKNQMQMSIERTSFCKCFYERSSKLYPKDFHRHHHRHRHHQNDDDDGYCYYYCFLWKDDRIERERTRDQSKKIDDSHLEY